MPCFLIAGFVLQTIASAASADRAIEADGVAPDLDLLIRAVHGLGLNSSPHTPQAPIVAKHRNLKPSQHSQTTRIHA